MYTMCEKKCVCANGLFSAARTPPQSKIGLLATSEAGASSRGGFLFDGGVSERARVARLKYLIAVSRCNKKAHASFAVFTSTRDKSFFETLLLTDNPIALGEKNQKIRLMSHPVVCFVGEHNF